MKVSLPQLEAESYIRSFMVDDAPFARLMRSSELVSAFAIVPDEIAPDSIVALSDFRAGKRWSQPSCDAALEEEVHVRFPGAWWALMECLWVRRGMLPHDDELGYFLTYRDEYLLPATEARSLELRRWRSNAVAFDKIIYLLEGGPDGGHSGVELDTIAANRLASRAFCMLVSAFDDESWVGMLVQ